MLKKEHKKKWKEVTELLAREQNFQKFREHLHSVDPPCTLALSFFREWADILTIICIFSIDVICACRQVFLTWACT